ncbi:MAG: sulfotransferase family protein [Cypionkella sp.]
MSLKIIGSGFGRTGTRSLKEALETLGFGPTHHMEEIFANPPQVANWQAVAAGRPVNWDEVFAGYNSQIDWPGAHVWRELAEHFPDAKVIHSQRPDEIWWTSFSKTIGKLMSIYPTLPLPPHIRDMMDAASGFILDKTFHGKWTDRTSALAAYHQREADVRKAIPANRLLVFDVADGWEPLCAFLKVPVPDMPFPNRNHKGDFWANLGGEPA